MGLDYRNYVPTKGDERYKKDCYKPALDIIRVEYYSKYGTDPSLNPSGYLPIFFDPSLQIYGKCYCFRGKQPFKIYLQSSYKEKIPDCSHTIGIEIDDKKFNDEILYFSLDLMKRLADKGPNLIVKSYGNRPRYTIAFISDADFMPYFLGSTYAYWDLFERLCDNNLRNIIYIGDDLKSGVSKEIIEKVEQEYVEADLAKIAAGTNIEDIRSDNAAICDKVAQKFFRKSNL